jgi:hypothetical protein
MALSTLAAAQHRYLRLLCLLHQLHWVRLLLRTAPKLTKLSGTGYTAGGNTLTISANPASSGTTAFLDFADTTWSSATITARGALIYLADGGTDPAVAVLDFGSDKTSTAGDFTIVFPAADASNAIIRIA